jgi:hypothetical protein
MLRSFRHIVFALVGWLTLAAAPAPNDSRHTNESNATKAVSRSLERIADAEAKQAETGEYQAPCAKGESNYQSDLCAQWQAARAATDAADSASWAVFWTFASLVLSGLGLIALLITIRQGREILDLERAPFLVIRIKDGKKVSWNGRNLLPQTILFEIENVGRGPATITRIHREWAVGPDCPQPIDVETPRPASRSKAVHITVGPGTKSDELDSLNESLIPIAAKDQVVGPNPWVSFLGYVEFNDLAGRRYISGFHHVWRGNLPKRGLHLALPQTGAEKYNYHRELKASRRSWHLPGTAGDVG